MPSQKKSTDHGASYRIRSLSLIASLCFSELIRLVMVTEDDELQAEIHMNIDALADAYLTRQPVVSYANVPNLTQSTERTLATVMLRSVKALASSLEKEDSAEARRAVKAVSRIYEQIQKHDIETPFNMDSDDDEAIHQARDALLGFMSVGTNLT